MSLFQRMILRRIASRRNCIDETLPETIIGFTRD